MKWNGLLLIGLLASAALKFAIRADERRFTYVYEPETLPQGAFEFENWVTLRSQRNEFVGQDNYHRWDLRQELEYGVSDRYTAALYLNEKAQSFRNPATGAKESDFTWQGLSLENRFNVWNPATHKIGLTLYLEGRYSGEEAALEQKIIIGQRYGNWKWAFNIEHETEWEDDLREAEGELGASLGLARDLGKRWALGLEFRNENILPECSSWENSALFLELAVACPAASADELTMKEITAAQKIYVAKCAKCHRFYEPTNYSEPDWRRWMVKMNQKSKLNAEQNRLLNRYLDAYRAGELRGKPQDQPKQR